MCWTGHEQHNLNNIQDTTFITNNIQLLVTTTYLKKIQVTTYHKQLTTYHKQLTTYITHNI